jgi:hypothetical protein
MISFLKFQKLQLTGSDCFIYQLFKTYYQNSCLHHASVVFYLCVRVECRSCMFFLLIKTWLMTTTV